VTGRVRICFHFEEQARLKAVAQLNKVDGNHSLCCDGLGGSKLLILT
jgi:hypothetical protein